MQIYHRSTMSFWAETHSDGVHFIHEIDDDDMGYWSQNHYIISREDSVRLFSTISEKEFKEICRKEGTEGMIRLFEAHNIPYRKE